MSDDLVERLKFAAKGLDSQWDKEIADDMMEAAAEIRSLREQVAQERAAVEAMRAERAGVVACARLEGMEIMREAAERAAEDATNTDWDDCCLDVMGDAVQSIQNLDPAAILAEHTRAKDKPSVGEAFWRVGKRWIVTEHTEYGCKAEIASPYAVTIPLAMRLGRWINRNRKTRR